MPPLPIDARVVRIPWLQRSRWKRYVKQKVGMPWLESDPDRRYMIEWAFVFNVGEMWHRDEALWLIIDDRWEAQVLIANYFERHYEALRFVFPTVIDLHTMD